MSGRRRRPPAPRPTPWGVKAVFYVLGALGVIFMALVAFGLTQLALPTVIRGFVDGDVVVVIGALTLAVLGIVSVAAAGVHPIRGLPFHATGIGAPFVLGSTFPFFSDLQIAGGILYGAAFCWGILVDLAVRVYRARSRRGQMPYP